MEDNNDNAPGFIIDWDTPYNTDTLEVASDVTPNAAIVEGNTGIELSDTTWKASELLASSDVMDDADIIAYARARHWTMFAITSVEPIDAEGYYVDPDDEPIGWTIIGKPRHAAS